MEEELLLYFEGNGHQGKLTVLDNKYRKFYTGVTLNYITYDLLKSKYKKSEVAEVLLKLQQNKQIKSLHCPDIKKYVFESSKSGHYYFSSLTGAYTSYGDKQYNVHDYLNKFINKKNE